MTALVHRSEFRSLCLSSEFLYRRAARGARVSAVSERSERQPPSQPADSPAQESVAGLSRRELLQVGAIGLLGVWPQLSTAAFQKPDTDAGTGAYKIDPPAP